MRKKRPLDGYMVIVSEGVFMSVLDVLYSIIIRPLELLFETVFSIANSKIANPGLSIIVLSLAVNSLVLPLYIRADVLQKEERDIEKKLKYWVDHIKRTFKGDERFMMLQAYYRENDYKPTYVFRSTLPLLLQVPFFIAAYRFLAGLKILQGFSFGPINDLGSPDGLLSAFGISINVLPILMTLINFGSSAVYTKGAPIRSKLQVYGTAMIFLVLLYRAPSGLAFYWTLNNVFSLLKNLFYKVRDCVKNLAGKAEDSKEKTVNGRNENAAAVGSTKVYIPAVLCITIFVGGLIPSAVISSSTTEFIDAAYLNNPIIYILYSLCISCGFFMVWLGVFYGLSKYGGKRAFSCIAWICSVIFTVDYIFFGTKFGNLSSFLQYDVNPVYEPGEILLNSIVLLAIIGIAFILYKKAPKIVITLLVSLMIVCIGLTLNNVRGMMKDFRHMKSVKAVAEDTDEDAVIRLSRDGKNVVILMMDRMIGYFVPFIMEEDESLYGLFDGFKCYPNTVSFGTSTNAGLPALMGGYEYTPEEMNKRDSELLKDKHNEALKVLPVLYENNGFDVTVIDPAYADYEDFTNLSIYDEYPDIHKYALQDSINKDNIVEGYNLYRNFFCYAVFRVSPAILQSIIYDNGNYNALERVGEVLPYSIQVCEDMEKAYGVDSIYYRVFRPLEQLESMTQIEEGERGSVVIMDNNATHAPTLLQLPDYSQKELVDNTAFGEEQFEKRDQKGRTLTLKDLNAVEHYHVNMSSMKRLGEWMNYLREQGVYDNTRIIIVSDHAYGLNLNDELLIDGANTTGSEGPMDCLWFNCALLVKDYNAKGFTIDDTFMTNADVPTLALKDLVKDPVNPFTDKRIDNSYKSQEDLKLMVTVQWHVNINNGNTFMRAPYYTVNDSIFKRDNWKYLGYY